MVKDHSGSERGNTLLPHGLLFSIFCLLFIYLFIYLFIICSSIYLLFERACL